MRRSKRMLAFVLPIMAAGIATTVLFLLSCENPPGSRWTTTSAEEGVSLAREAFDPYPVAFVEPTGDTPFYPTPEHRLAADKMRERLGVTDHHLVLKANLEELYGVPVDAMALSLVYRTIEKHVFFGNPPKHVSDARLQLPAVPWARAVFKP